MYRAIYRRFSTLVTHLQGQSRPYVYIYIPRPSADSNIRPFPKGQLKCPFLKVSSQAVFFVRGCFGYLSQHAHNIMANMETRPRTVLNHHTPKRQFFLKRQKLLSKGSSRYIYQWLYPIYMGFSENSGTPKSSVLIGFSIINVPFLETPI